MRSWVGRIWAVAVLVVGFAALGSRNGGDSCVTCTSGKPCGDSCIARERSCSAGAGCACDGVEPYDEEP